MADLRILGVTNNLSTSSGQYIVERIGKSELSSPSPPFFLLDTETQLMGLSFLLDCETYAMEDPSIDDDVKRACQAT